MLQIPWLNVLTWSAMVFFGLGAQLLEPKSPGQGSPDELHVLSLPLVVHGVFGRVALGVPHTG